MATVYPNVPDVPGVPPLLRNPLVSAVIPQLLFADSVLGWGPGLAPAWGVYSGSNGLPVIIADTVRGIEYKKEWAIATYPLESGAFASYDKVETPYTAIVEFTSGGSLADRQLLLDSIDAISGDLNLYDVVTPEKIYVDANLQRIGYRRHDGRDSGIITVTVGLVEIRITAGVAGANSQSPSGALQSQDGTVQPGTDVPPTAPSVQGVASGASVTSTAGPTGFNPAPVSVGSGNFNLLPVQ
jgi:hypothetical protein